jgi:hypothetical protein
VLRIGYDEPGGKDDAFAPAAMNLASLYDPDGSDRSRKFVEKEAAKPEAVTGCWFAFPFSRARSGGLETVSARPCQADGVGMN